MSSRNFVLLLVGIAIAAFLVLKPRPYSIGDKVDTFTLSSANGGLISLNKYRGKVVFLEFFATWCPYCKQAYPRTVELSNNYRDNSDVVFVKISCGEDLPVVKAFIEANKSHWDVLVDPDDKVQSKFFKDGGVPAFVIIDKQGRLVYTQYGWSSAFIATFQFNLNNALEGN